MQALAIVGAFEEESDAAPGLGEILVVDAMNLVGPLANSRIGKFGRCRRGYFCGSC